MDELARVITNRYFGIALREASATRAADKMAADVFSSEGGARTSRIENLASWIRLYKVNRVKWDVSEEQIPTSFAEAVADAAITWADERDGHEVSVPRAFHDLRWVIEDLYSQNQKSDRSFISLTSKVLSCWRPSAAPIYDKFAGQSVWALVKLYKSYKFCEPYDYREEIKCDNKIGYEDWSRANKVEKDIWNYRDYYHSHCLIYAHFKPFLLKGLESVEGHVFEPLKVFDKLLWTFGNFDIDYSLSHVSQGETDAWR